MKEMKRAVCWVRVLVVAFIFPSSLFLPPPQSLVNSFAYLPGMVLWCPQVRVSFFITL